MKQRINEQFVILGIDRQVVRCHGLYYCKHCCCSFQVKAKAICMSNMYVRIFSFTNARIEAFKRQSNTILRNDEGKT